jgi:hypothetical protein
MSTRSLSPLPRGIWFWVEVATQRVIVLEGDKALWEAPVSTSAYGCGEEVGSFQTPRGWHRVCQKIGEGHPLGAVFRGRKPTGEVWAPGDSCKDRLILTRILWLDGLEEHNRTSRKRFIYFHGTNWEDRVGTPTSCGCVCLKNQDMLVLYGYARKGTLVYIAG